MHPLLNIALRAARDASESLAHKAARLDRIKVLDSDPASFTTSADVDSDETLRYHILKAYPSHSIQSRVSGDHQGDEGEPVWMIDPLVGSLNYSSGYSRFGVSIAVSKDGNVEHAVIVCPMQNDEFTASRGQGSQLNSRRIRAESDDIAGALLGLDYVGAEAKLLLEFQSELMQAGAHPRIGGHGALDVVDVACGRLQGGWCTNLHQSSLAAANLILLEAGGLLGTESGNPKLDTGREQLFASTKIFKQLVKLRMRHSG